MNGRTSIPIHLTLSLLRVAIAYRAIDRGSCWHIRENHYMKALRFVSVLGLAILIFGCSVSPPQPEASKFTSETAAQANVIELCIDYNASSSPVVYQALQAKHAFNEADERALQTSSIILGMSRVGLICLYGMPETRNNTVTESGKREQWVYCRNYMLSAHLRKPIGGGWLDTPTSAYERCGEHAYVYLDNNRLVAHQNVP